MAFFFALVPFSVDEIRNGQSGWTIRAPTLDVPGLNWVNDLLVHKLEWTGDVAHLPKVDFAMLQEQILLFLVVFGLLTLVDPRADALGVRPGDPRGAQLGGRGRRRRASRSTGQGHDLRPLGRDRRHRRRAARHVSASAFTDTTAPPLIGLFWLALAVTFGVRRPGGALLAGFAFAGGTAVFHWTRRGRSSAAATCRRSITSIYFVPILSGLGAIQLAQEPDGILSLAGQQKLRKKREKVRLARIADAGKRPTHGGEVPAHEMQHSTEDEAPGHRDGRRSPVGADVAEATFAVRGVVAGYGDAEVLHGVDLVVEPGKVTALLGANGAGKSTLCAVAAGLVEPARARC